MSLPPRFLDKVAPEPNSGCWLWMGYCSPVGYGTFHVGEKTVLAHRFSFERVKGLIPEGLQLDHLCRVRCCVNPDHLELVTPKVNTARSEAGRVNSLKNHCPLGHEYSESNTRVYKGMRFCRACHIIHVKRSRIRHGRG